MISSATTSLMSTVSSGLHRERSQVTNSTLSRSKTLFLKLFDFNSSIGSFLFCAASENQQVVDLQDILKKFTFDNICNVVFDVDPGSFKRIEEQFINEKMKRERGERDIMYFCKTPTLYIY